MWSRGSMWFVSLYVILCAFTFSFMYCITYLWWWDLCDMCALYIWYLYICHVTCLCSFALLPRFTLIQMSFTFMYSCLIHIYWVHHVVLGHISMSNPFALIVKSLYEPSMLKTSLISSTYSRLYCRQSPKRGRLKASRPLVGFRWLMMTRDYYD